MFKKEISTPTKFNCLWSFPQFKKERLKTYIELEEHSISITLTPGSSSEYIKNWLYPIYQKSQNSYKINYSLIKSITAIESTQPGITMEITNPVVNTNITMAITNLESKGFFVKKHISSDIILLIVLYIKKMTKMETQKLIERFLDLIEILKSFWESQKEENNKIDFFLIQSYSYGKGYYEKYMQLYKKNLKIRSGIKKQINEKIKLFEALLPEQELMKRNLVCACFDSWLNEFKTQTSIFVEESVLLFFEIWSIENEIINLKKVDNKKVSTNWMSLQNEINISSPNWVQNINAKALNMKFGKNIYFKTSVKRANVASLNKTSSQLFHPKNFETMNELNLTDNNIQSMSKNNWFSKYNYPKSNLSNNLKQLNKTETLSISTKTTSKEKQWWKEYKDVLETPKFTQQGKPNTINTPNVEEDNHRETNNQLMKKSEAISMNEITEKIEIMIEYHTFVPPSDVFNIFWNTSEIIHRKFFDIWLSAYWGEIFTLEYDRDNFLKISSMYNCFLYYRGLKNLLFNETNKLYFSSILFMNNELK